MSRRTTQLIKAGLATLYYTGGHRLISPIARGVGVIFVLNSVMAEGTGEFACDGVMRASPECLEETILSVKATGYDIVSLDEVHWRLTEGAFDRPFAAFTFEDGYRDAVEVVHPIFARHGLPFTLYVPGTFPDGHADLWWLALERVIAEVDRLSLKMDGELRELRCSTAAEKSAAYEAVHGWLCGIGEDAARGVVRELCRGIGYDAGDLGRRILRWEDLRRMAQDPRVTIGAHGSRHYALARLSEAEARAEIEMGAQRLERELGRRPRHMSFPCGTARGVGERDFRLAREAGFKTATTLHTGLLYPSHSGHLTALPRIALAGAYQNPRYLDVLLSGAPSLIARAGRLGSP